MKVKQLFVILLAALSMNVWAEQISEDEAAAIAASFVNNQPALRRMHKSAQTASSMRLVHKAMQNNSDKEAFYVFNQEGDNGFVIVSADDRTAEEVLGYSVNGSFDVEKINPSLKWWLSRYVEEITVLQTMDESDVAENVAARKAKKAVTAIAPLLKKNGTEITWDQEAPYYNSCPIDSDNKRSLTGCVATATAQVMCKWGYPAQGTGSHEYTWTRSNDKTQQVSANFGETTYDWDNMLPAYSGVSSTSAQKTAVATLMFHAGVACEMDYGSSGSGAWTDDMAYGLKTYFGYEFDKFITMYASKSAYQKAKGANVANVTAEYGLSSSDVTSYFNTDLEAGRPIIMGGEDSDGGHEFVCCGRDANNMFYINWGWEGSSNGYFAITALKPTSTNYDFSTHLDAIIGLRPGKEYADVNVTWMADGELFANTVAAKGVLSLPTNEPEACASGKVFVGWTATENYENETSAPTYIKAGTLLEEDATYYAVFATAGEGGGEETWNLVTDASTLKDGDVLVIASSSKGKTAGAISSNVMGEASTTFSSDQSTITSLGSGTVELTLGGSEGEWTLSSTSGALGATAVKKLAWGSGTTTWSISISDGNATIQNGTESYGRFLHNVNNVRFTTYTSDASSTMLLPQLYRKGGGTSYSDYSTSCGAPVEKFGITINPSENGSLATSPATEAAAGKTVTITATPAEHYHLATLSVKDAGNADVAVSGTGNTRTFTMPEKAVTISATFAEDEKFTINFYVNGTVEKTQSLFAGQTAEGPAVDAPCEGYTFAGWATAAQTTEVTEKPTLITSFTVSKAQDYYAVFSRTVTEGEPQLTNNYKQITSTSDLTTGNYIVAGYYNSNYYAMKNALTSNGYYIDQQQVTVGSKGITTTDGNIIWKITVDNEKLSFYNEAVKQYVRIYQNSTKINAGLTTSSTDNILFTYSVETSGWWKFINTVLTSYYLEYYGSKSDFSAYTSAGTDPIYLFKQQSENQSTTYYTTETNCAACESKLTIKKGTAAHGTFALSKEDGEYESCSKIVVNVTDITPATGYTFKAITQSGLAEGVTIDQETKTVTYAKNVTGSSTISVEFEALPKYEVRFYNNGKLIDTQEVIKGNKATAPIIGTCEGYTFVGWWTAELAEDNKESKTWVTDFTITEEKEFFAIYSRVEGGTGADFDGKTEGTYMIYAKAGEIKYYATASINSNKKLESTTTEADAAEFTFTKVDGGFTIKNNDNYLAYEGNSTNLSLGNSAYTWAISAGTSGHGSWHAIASTTASASTVRALVIRVTSSYQTFGAYATTNTLGTEYFELEICASSTTYYTSTVTCGGGGTDVENATAQEQVAVKAIVNGQIVIIRGEQMYTITGARVK